MSWFPPQPSFTLYQAEKDDLQSTAPLPWPGDFVYLLSYHWALLGCGVPARVSFLLRSWAYPERMASTESPDARASESTGSKEAGSPVTETGA